MHGSGIVGVAGWTVAKIFVSYYGFDIGIGHTDVWRLVIAKIGSNIQSKPLTQQRKRLSVHVPLAFPHCTVILPQSPFVVMD